MCVYVHVHTCARTSGKRSSWRICRRLYAPRRLIGGITFGDADFRWKRALPDESPFKRDIRLSDHRMPLG